MEKTYRFLSINGEAKLIDDMSRDELVTAVKYLIRSNNESDERHQRTLDIWSRCREGRRSA